jgi:hypothetical protein
MSKKSSRISLSRLILVGLLVLSNLLFGFPADMLVEKWNQSKIVDNLYLAMRDSKVVDVAKERKPTPKLVQKAQAANFSMQTGYYVGNGSSQSISGLGFQPQTVIIRAGTTAGQGIWKTSAMPANNSAFFSATANNTGSLITLNADGFSVATNANVTNANVRYNWIAFAGSDCTSSGTFCVGTYTGNGSNPRKITTGFQPSFVMVKRSTALAGGASFRTASMAANMGQYTLNTAQVTNGSLFTTLVSDGFNVGSINNTSAGIYYYIAFKSVAGVMAEGTYTGNGVDNRNITGFGASATPNFAIIKNATSATANNRNPMFNSTHSYGDHSSYLAVTTTNAANMIQGLQTDGFQVGGGVNANENAQTIYWAAFGGAASSPPGAGTFDMATGSYSGNGTSQSVSGLGFSPDLVIIKDNAANQSVFRTSLMAANNTAYLASATANFTGGITSLSADGFSVGASATVNGSGGTYHWQAFGNAYKPTINSGAADFMIGAYMGSGTDNRNITGLPTQPDMVATKRSGATAGAWRSSANSGDQSNFFAATAQGANRIQSLSTFGYQVGTAANVNTNNNLYNWFAFKSGDNFAVGSYTGTGSAQNISPGFQPDLAWIKRSTAVNGVFKASSLVGDSTQYFNALANVTNRITDFDCNVFSVGGNITETNATSATYRYAVWRVPDPGTLGIDIVDGGGCSLASPVISMSAATASFDCTTTIGTLGTSGQKLRLTNTTGNPGWSLTIAATSGENDLWGNGSEEYDFNDPNGSPPGCNDGADADSGEAGQLTLDPSSATITPKSGCTSTGVSLGSAAAFAQGVLNSLTLVTANSANTNCYWDFTSIGASQKVPREQPPGTYTLNLTVTVTAN